MLNLFGFGSNEQELVAQRSERGTKKIKKPETSATPQKEESIALTLEKESLGAIAFLVCCMGMLFLWIVF